MENHNKNLNAVENLEQYLIDFVDDANNLKPNQILKIVGFLAAGIKVNHKNIEKLYQRIDELEKGAPVVINNPNSIVINNLKESKENNTAKCDHFTADCILEQKDCLTCEHNKDIDYSKSNKEPESVLLKIQIMAQKAYKGNDSGNAFDALRDIDNFIQKKLEEQPNKYSKVVTINEFDINGNGVG